MPLAAQIPNILPLCPWRHEFPHIPFSPWRQKFPTYTIMPLAAQIPNILPFSPWRHEFPHIPLCPWRHKFPKYYHLAPGGTNFHITHLAPGGTNSPNIIYFVSARVNILFHTIPLDGLPSKKDIHINKGFPTTCVSGTNPQKRLSSELCLLSPIIQ